jgi:hypothetical protein
MSTTRAEARGEVKGGVNVSGTTAVKSENEVHSTE